MKKITIIGGGPAALMLAAQLNKKKYQITIYDKKKALGRKFLVAGEGGLNLTYNAPVNQLVAQYVPPEFMEPIIDQFNNMDLIKWFNALGVNTFIGTSNRVFPDLTLKPIEVLKKMLALLTINDVKLCLGTNWIGWNSKGHLRFEGIEDLQSDIVIFALGGASWKVTGSDGKWKKAFESYGIKTKSFRAANCAFKVDWAKEFIATHSGKPLKNIAVSYKDHISKGELVISNFGIEGNAIYALSEKIQNTLQTQKNTTVYLDLKPTMTLGQIKTKYNKSRFRKVTEILKQDINLDRTSISLLKQSSDRDTFLDSDRLVSTIKRVPIVIHSADEIDKAISTLGGIDLNEIDEHFQLKKIPNTYAIGEMLDWFAPTGGYLLQGCFSMGFALANHLNKKA